jgi:diguanylate cyclase (GGDEF)-like protein
VPVRIFNRNFSPYFSVFAPLTLLSLIFVGFLVALFAKAGPTVAPDPLLIISGALCYAAAIIILVRFGLANIKNLESLGLTDSLSHLPNRRALHKDARQQEADHAEVALALIDLDGFKLVNDHYGHFIGDRLIKECAGLLVEVCGEDARAYRLGGDEFAIMAKGAVAGIILEGICRKLLHRLSEPFKIDDRAIAVGASIGLSRSAAATPVSSSELLRRSDVAMYASKRAGKMRCTWFSGEFDINRATIRNLEGELRDALEGEQFRVHYQPLVDATSKRIVAVEALLRWERPDGKRIGPDLFIPIAEESGLINPIGLWVLKQACTDALAWGDIELSVNVSSAQLRNPEFPIHLGQILEETGFPPHRLELEITETYLIVDPEVANRSLEVIRDFGIRIVLDDFGTGYASIGFLRQFRFEKLKIDRSLVVDASNDAGAQAMMLASIAVARALKMEVTAEGVETEAQADMVRLAGCDQIQGWLYHKPMPAVDLTRQVDSGLDEASLIPILQPKVA